MTAPAPLTAHTAGLVSCHACSTLSPAVPPTRAHDQRCPRCDSALHARKPDSIARTWALLIAAGVFYIPANVFPVMTVTYLGSASSDTILSGVIHLLEAGDVPIALLVFFASVVVPLLKLLALGYLVLTVQRGSTWRPDQRTRLYRLLEAVGRWSMLDIFMISILVSLVQMGSLATIEAGAGATSFAAVVVLTMLAAQSFDPRLIWDAALRGGDDA